MPSVFISYSSEDQRAAEALAHALRQYDIDVWVDYEQIGPGDGISDEISTGLEQADALLFLLSEDSVESPWCRKEYQAALKREIEAGQTLVIPLQLEEVEPPPLLADKRYVRLQRPIDKESVAEIAAKIQSLPETKNQISTSPGKEVPAVTPSLVKSLVFLLLLDRFEEEGVWGRSMAEISGAYGHEEDPGSITISTWAIRGLSLVTDSIGTEVTDLCGYLNNRTASNGAIGMKKEIGNWVTRSEIIPNRRHTAVGAQYLRKYCGALDRAFNSLRYVINNRTETGAWSAIGEVSDDTADPLTTAYVLRVLRDFHKSELLNKLTFPEDNHFLSEYWKSGLLWLYQVLTENSGWWLYKGRSEEPREKILNRKFSYTANILMILPEFANEHPDYSSAYHDIVMRMKEVWDDGRPGLPTGPNDQTVELGTTLDYARAVWMLREDYPKLANKLVEDFLSNLENILIYEDSDAKGWSKSLVFLSELRSIPDINIDMENIREDTKTIKKHYKESTLDTKLISESHPEWVGRIANNEILPVESRPL